MGGTGLEPPPRFWLWEGKPNGRGWVRTSGFSQIANRKNQARLRDSIYLMPS